MNKKYCTIFPRLILDVDCYHNLHRKMDIRQQLRDVTLQLISTAPQEFANSSAVWQFLQVTKYFDVMSESTRQIVEQTISEKKQEKELPR